jgi:hypothetical protein
VRRRSRAYKVSRVAFAIVMALTGALTTAAIAKPSKHRSRTTKASADAQVDGASEAIATRESAAPSSKSASLDGGGAVESTKTLDGGNKVFKFGEVEIEGRLRSPQLVYFLRRVRAEFAAGDLGHRSFMRELVNTRNDPNF